MFLSELTTTTTNLEIVEDACEIKNIGNVRKFCIFHVLHFSFSTSIYSFFMCFLPFNFVFIVFLSF